MHLLLFSQGGADVNCNSDIGSPIMVAAKNLCESAMATMMQKTCKLDLKDKEGRTCLHCVAMSKDDSPPNEEVRVLLPHQLPPQPCTATPCPPAWLYQLAPVPRLA